MAEHTVTQEADQMCKRMAELDMSACAGGSATLFNPKQMQHDLPVILGRRCKLKGITGEIKTDGFRICDHTVQAVPFYYETADGFVYDIVGRLCPSKCCLSSNCGVECITNNTRSWEFHKELPELYAEFWEPNRTVMHLARQAKARLWEEHTAEMETHLALCVSTHRAHPHEYAQSCALSMLAL
jgi:hypothetical protein